MDRGTGGLKSHFDIRTFAFPVKAYPNQSGGQRYGIPDIEDQGTVGICTSISLTQNARKCLGRRFSAEFQYLMQKKYFDKNWDEGSSILNALKAAKGVEDSNGNFLYGGLLPAENWTYTTEDDRNLPYSQYIAKLQAIPDSELQKLFQISKQFRVKAYASVPVTRDSMAQAIDASKSGILSRYDLGKEWFTNAAGLNSWHASDIEPLRPPQTVISGHAVTDSNYDGESFRIANTWSTMWAEGGTAYRLQSEYEPTECWAVFFTDVPDEIQKLLDRRNTLIGQALDLIQKIIDALFQHKV